MKLHKYEIKDMHGACNATLSRLRDESECELGVELELEGWWDKSKEETIEKIGSDLLEDYIYEIGTDVSVKDHGTEIRFNHFGISEWKLDEITHILHCLKDAGLKTGPSAGMHIHYSCPDVSVLNKYWNSDKKHKMTLPFLSIGARSKPGGDDYGLGEDLFRDTEDEFGTFEIRAFETTLNPLVFYNRLVVTKYILDYIRLSGVFRILENMPRDIKKAYYFLCTTENPHIYGYGIDKIKQKLR